MSGGHFDYVQFHIEEIAYSVESIIRNNNKLKNKEELDSLDNDYKYSKEIINEFKKGLKALRIAYVYAQRIDWLLSGDDGEESFLKRLKQDLNEKTKI